MGGGAAEVEAGDRRARGEPLVPHLVGHRLALEDVPAGEPDAVLDVRSAQHLVVLEARLDVGRERAIRSMNCCAMPSRAASHVVSSSAYGAYWPNTLIRCLPSGAGDGS